MRRVVSEWTHAGTWKRAVVALLFVTTLHANWFEENRRIVSDNLTGTALILSWGYFTWDYGTRSPHIAHEGWFGKKTKHGGMDKLGHLYTNYLLSQMLASRFRHYGYDKKYAAVSGALSSFFLNAVMEVGDSFGDYGFSYEDIVFNAIGASLGYLMLTDRKLADLIDIRIEYFPSRKVRSGEDIDVFTDYDGMKYLTAFKFSAIEGAQRSFWSCLELQAGYYSVGSVRQRRTLFVGLGVNFSKLLKPVSGRIAHVLKFYQPPFGYLRTK